MRGTKSTIFAIKRYSARTNFSHGQPGILGPSLLRENLSLPGGCLVETMHLIYEGVCKIFNFFYFKKKQFRCYLSINFFYTYFFPPIYILFTLKCLNISQK